MHLRKQKVQYNIESYNMIDLLTLYLFIKKTVYFKIDLVYLNVLIPFAYLTIFF